MDVLDERRPCLTSKGRIGWAPKGSDVGDLIAAVVGSETPLVLRPKANEEYAVVGPSYIHGIMDGEAAQDEQGLKEMYDLRIV